MRARCFLWLLLTESCLFYLLPTIGRFFEDHKTCFLYLTFILPLVVFPLCCLILSSISCCISGFDMIFPIATTIIYVPAALACYTDVATAILHAISYGIFGIIGQLVILFFSFLTVSNPPKAKKERLQKRPFPAE